MSASVDLPHKHPISVDDFQQMGHYGILMPNARVELIDGDIIDMAPIGSFHSGIVTYLIQAFSSQLDPKQAIVSAQNPMVLGDYSAPQPDLLILTPRPDFYRDSHATAADVKLLIEVSDTTLKFDRETKIPLYAQHGISETWIVNAKEQRVELYRSPNAANALYEDMKIVLEGSITPVHLALEIDVSSIFG